MARHASYGEVFDHLTDSIKLSKLGRQVKKVIHNMGSTTTCKKLTIVKMDLLNGKSTTLRILPDEIVLIDTWYTECTACRAMFLSYLKSYKKYKKKGFEIITISIDVKENKSNLRNTIKKTYDMEKLLGYWRTNSAKRMGIHKFPTTFLLDWYKMILKKILRYLI